MIVRMTVPMTPATRGRDAQVPLPQTARARPPHLPPVRLGRDAGELRVRVVHVEHFVAQDLFEDRARRRIVVDDIAIDRETAGRRLLRHVQEREQTMVGFSFDGQVVEPVAAGKGTACRTAPWNESRAVRRRAAPR